MSELRIWCRVDPFTESNVVTLRGATPEEANRIFSTAHERSSDCLYQVEGQRTLWLKDLDVFIHHHVWAGGEVELLSYHWSCEQLLDLLPKAVRSRVKR